MKKSLFLVAALFALAACTRSQEIDVPEANLSLFAKTESAADSRTVVEGGTHVYWEPGDEIMVFSGEKSAKFVSELAASSATATFKGTFGEETWPEDMDLWAVYPYSEEAVFDGETITTVFPSEQVARAGSFGKDMNLAIAHNTGTTLQFYNVGGGVRFSVTEEGIKKVMFEGLGGEVLSGKVKVGFEDGVPIVKDVTGGSQFITLLPPEGSETFEKNTWYYIVAIPGALEKGYKLRFYKDDDYARRVSEKAVQIKRSIFGNIEKADEGIEYEAQTLHFPKTDEEIKESSELMSVVNEDVNSVIKESTDISTIAEDLKKVDGVIDVIVDESNNTIAVQQKDSVWINYFLDSERIYAPMSFASPTSQSSAGDNHGFHSPRKFSSTNSDHETIDNAHFNKKRNAIILAPYVFDYDLNGLKSALMAGGLGISEDNIIIKQEHQVLLSDFLGSNLSRYDVIMIISHGGIGCGAYHQPEKPLATIIDTGIPYSEQTAEVLSDSGRITLDKVAFIGGENLTFAMTSDFIGDANFNNASVFLMACHSAEHLDDEGSLVKVFLDSKAGIVTGNNRTVHSTVTSRINSKITYLMSKGFSLQNAFTQIEESDYISAFCDNWYEQVVWYETNVSHPQEYSVKDDFDVLNTYVIEENPSLSSKEYYLIDPFPSDLNNTLDNGYVDLTWSCPLEPFSDSWRYPDAERIGVSTGGFYYVSPSPTDTYTIVYDIYVDGRPIHQIIDTQDQIHEKRVRWEYVSSDKLTYKWFVVAHILKNNLIVASYRSIEDEITLKPDPPQVETFPASVDVSYVFLSGDVTNRSLEGLETGFYYYKMTAEEATTQLSSEDSLRFALSGNTILSTGDYKDYFGVNLTDIEKNSKYLFMAYAKDEYDQMGLGGVLSFEIGDESQHNYAIPDAIDLGLPSGLKWASFNLGASKPEEYGDYYAWGETEPYYSSLEPLTWQEGKEKGYFWSSYKWCMGSYSTITKYCPESDTESGYNGFTDNKTVLDAEDDAAYMALGGKWRIPTDAELIELRTYCVWEWISMNGIDGFKVTGYNGNSIFLPAAGWWSGTSIRDVGLYGGYYSSSVYTRYAENAYFMYFYSGYISYYDELENGDRCLGHPVRPVYDDLVTKPDNTEPISVDLGLPSGLKWASFNLGATKPEEYGDYYAWGDVEPYYKSLDPLTWNEGKETGYSWASYKWCMGSNNTLTKYCSNPLYGNNGFTDTKTVIDSEDDAARVTLEGNWRMPTEEDWEELFSYCLTWEWTETPNGIKGVKVMGINENSIFLPAAGYRNGTGLYDAGALGSYWSSSLDTSHTYCSYHAYFDSSGESMGINYRYYGRSVRPVSE